MPLPHPGSCAPRQPPRPAPDDQPGTRVTSTGDRAHPLSDISRFRVGNTGVLKKSVRSRLRLTAHRVTVPKKPNKRWPQPRSVSGDRGGKVDAVHTGFTGFVPVSALTRLHDTLWRTPWPRLNGCFKSGGPIEADAYSSADCCRLASTTCAARPSRTFFTSWSEGVVGSGEERSPQTFRPI